MKIQETMQTQNNNFIDVENQAVVLTKLNDNEKKREERGKQGPLKSLSVSFFEFLHAWYNFI